LETERSTANEKDRAATVTCFVEQEIPPYDNRQGVLTLSTDSVWNTEADHTLGRVVTARAYPRHKSASAVKAIMAKVVWDFSGGFFDWPFKVKQLLQQSPNLDDFFIARLSETSTAMLSYC
jgi:hypothetical protein